MFQWLTPSDVENYHPKMSLFSFLILEGRTDWDENRKCGEIPSSQLGEPSPSNAPPVSLSSTSALQLIFPSSSPLAPPPTVSLTESDHPARRREAEQMAARAATRQSQRGIKWERRQKMSPRLWEMRKDDFYQTPKTFSPSTFLLLPPPDSAGSL